ncbi:MAG: polysaccharide biosynthesis tyrosine autokinase [Dehalococcoidia bacterium]|nr:polysaccharide biosynthesis tyrosine autokinase [Dehalococcoidia bacterium]
MELRQYFNLVKNWLWLIVLSVVLCSAVSYGVSKSLPKIYEASATLIVGTVVSSSNPDYSSILASQAMAKTYSKLLTSRPILEGTIKSLKLEDELDAAQLAESVTVDSVVGTQLLILRIRGEDTEQIARLANGIAAELLRQSPTSPQGSLGSVMTFVQKQMSDLETEISSIQQQIKDKQAAGSAGGPATATATADDLASLQTKLRSAQDRYNLLLPIRTGVSNNYVSVIEEAQTPTVPISPKVTQNVMLAALLGFLLAVGVAFLVEYLDDTAKSPERITELLNVPTLGLVSRLSHKEYSQGLITLREPKSPATEGFRALRTSIQFSSPDKPLKSLLVTSSDPGDGKTTIMGNLAVCLAQAGLKVIAVDTDLRRPSVHKLFGMSNTVGLTSLLSGQVTDIADVIKPTDEPNLSVVTSGPPPPNSSELLGSQRFQGIVSRLHEQADLLIFDSPPALMVTDAVLLSTKVDGVVIVVDTARTRMGSLKQAVESVRNVGGVVLGVVLNKIGPEDGRYYYYHYYRYYNYSADGKPGAGTNGRSRWLGWLPSWRGRTGARHEHRATSKVK